MSACYQLLFKARDNKAHVLTICTKNYISCTKKIRNSLVKEFRVVSLDTSFKQTVKYVDSSEGN